MSIGHHVLRNGNLSSFYKCANHEFNPLECPKSNIIYYDELKRTIEQEIKHIIYSTTKDDKLMNDFIKRQEAKLNTVDDKKLRKSEARLQSLLKVASKLYDDYNNLEQSDIAKRLTRDPSDIAFSASDAQVFSNALDKRWYVNVLSYLFGILGV